MHKTLLVLVVFASQEINACRAARAGALSYLGVCLGPALKMGANLVMQPPHLYYAPVIEKSSQRVMPKVKNVTEVVQPKKFFGLSSSLSKPLEIPSLVRETFTDPIVVMRELEKKYGVVLVPRRDSSIPVLISWTRKEEDILDRLRGQLPVSYTLPEEYLPPLEECHEEIIRLMGEFFRLRGQDSDLPQINQDNIFQLRYIFQKFVDVGFVRQKDIKLYRDHFFEFDD